MATVAHAGLEMSMKSNTRFTNVWAELQDPEALVQAPVYKLKDPGTRVQAHKLVQGTSYQDKSIFFVFNVE